MRFDDSLNTVLAADATSGVGAQATWRQLVDLVGRGRVAADEPVIARLRMLREVVPVGVRAASARSLAFATPGARLVGFFAEDILSVAAAVLSTATLPAEEWTAMLPRLTPAGRAVLRNRRDLPESVTRALASFGSTDFVLPNHAPASDAEAVAEPAPPAKDTPLSTTPFVALGVVARGLPLVAEALRQSRMPDTDQASVDRFEIADLVARIDAFNRKRDEQPVAAPPAPPRARTFRLATDAAGIVMHVDGVAPGALVGVSIAHAVRQGMVSVDAVMSGALRRRARFCDARIDIDGHSDAAGAWLVSGVPAFDDRSGRFIGLRATARRPRLDERAEPDADRQAASDTLRQLVHELRTPANAISGFAELIEAQLLGPVDAAYRERAIVIRDQAARLIAAIEDLDTAARIEGGALDLRPTAFALLPMIERVIADLAPLATLRGAAIALDADGDHVVVSDDRTVERLVARLLSTLVSAAGGAEIIGVRLGGGTPGTATIEFDRPAALVTDAEEDLLRIGVDAEDEDAPLLGTGFAIRLSRNLASELGGVLTIGADRLTLRLPVAGADRLDQAMR
ncbi:sensor histidine kinase [Sphingomonas sp. Tas61C01]|uniref:sensor histidine kinase n=1 Tax=Sphingomonas sp. Tas61C01 TaxID=3458297 RepID=UPI00403EEB4A